MFHESNQCPAIGLQRLCGIIAQQLDFRDCDIIAEQLDLRDCDIIAEQLDFRDCVNTIAQHQGDRALGALGLNIG